LPLALRALLLILLALVPAGVVQLIMEREARAARTEQIGQQATRLARMVAEQQTRTIEGARQVLAAMTAHEAVRALQPGAECDQFLRSIVQAAPRYITASVLNREGDLVCSGRREAFSSNSADRAYFRQALADRGLSVGEYSVGRRSGQPSIHLSLPLLDEAGEVRGVVAVALSIEWLVRDLQSLALPPGASATIADRRGTILARSLESEKFVGQPLPPFAMELMHRAEPGTIDAPALDGVRRVAAFLPLAESPPGFFIALGLDASAALNEAAARDRRAAAMILGSLVLAVLLGLLGFNALIQRPVRRMLDLAARWGRQDWSARLGRIGGGREFRRLAAAFDAMASAVQHREEARAESEHRMQALLDLSPQVVFTTDPRGRMLWINRWWWNYTGTPARTEIHRAWKQALHPGDGPARTIAREAALRGVEEGGEGEFLNEQRIRRASDGQYRWHLCKGVPMRDTDGEVTGWIGVALDIHDMRMAREEAALSAERLRVTYESAPVGLCLYDRELRYLAINERLAATNGHPAAAHLGRPLAEMAPHVHDLIGPILREVIATGEPCEDLEVRGRDPNAAKEGPGGEASGEASGEAGGEERVWLANFHPVRDAAGEVSSVSVAVLDITARKQAEDAQYLLSREVDHRAKNVLAVVRSLVRLSAAEAPDDVNALVEVLEGRIAAMARVHTMLARERWVGADLRAIVNQELDAYTGSTSLDGPPVRLLAAAAQPLTMILHELATNAAKYGALSLPEGHVSIAWRRVDAEAGDGGVELEWTERGGPPIAGPPRREGFGSRLIEANAGAQLAGSIERHWEPQGLRCVLRIGPEALVREAAAPLAGRRVLVLKAELRRGLEIAAQLTQLGCEVVGPATSTESALALLRAQGRVDAAVLDAGHAGPVAEPLRRQAAALVVLVPEGEPPAGFPDAVLLDADAEAAAVRRALLAALGRSRAVMVRA
jgi:PAS domain S-box-containing protein